MGGVAATVNAKLMRSARPAAVRYLGCIAVACLAAVLYVLLAGNVIADAEPPTRIARGTVFGHASLLGAGTASVTVRAASEAVLLRMPAAGFASLAALYPPALAHLAEIASEPLPASERLP